MRLATALVLAPAARDQSRSLAPRADAAKAGLGLRETKHHTNPSKLSLGLIALEARRLWLPGEDD